MKPPFDHGPWSWPKSSSHTRHTAHRTPQHQKSETERGLIIASSSDPDHRTFRSALFYSLPWETHDMLRGWWRGGDKRYVVRGCADVGVGEEIYEYRRVRVWSVVHWGLYTQCRIEDKKLIIVPSALLLYQPPFPQLSTASPNCRRRFIPFPRCVIIPLNPVAGAWSCSFNIYPANATNSFNSTTLL